MRKINPARKRKPGAFKIPLLFLILALIFFGFDLFHFVRHLGHDPDLWTLPGVSLKLIWKILLCLILLLLIRFSYHLVFPCIGFFLFASPVDAFAVPSRDPCGRARELMTDSGTARDAKEDFLGRVKIKPPRSPFPSEMDKVTWWGTFKPFEFWGSPEFQAVWINPQGRRVASQNFRGGKCILAKTALNVENLPTRTLEPGMWRVIVSCKEVVIDNRPFAVVGSGISTADSGERGQEVMIWVDDVS